MGSYDLSSARCGAAIPPTVVHRICPTCGGDPAFRYGLSHVRLDRELPGIWRFIDLLPLANPEQIVPLQEGNTPLIPANLSDEPGTHALWKLEMAAAADGGRSVGRVVA